MTAAWFEVLDISGVPPEQYESCYAAAMQARAQRKADGEQLSHLTADELAAEWLKIRRLHDEMNRQAVKMLPETAATVCPRCDGTGLERMPNGSRRPGCKHDFADEDAAAHIIERDAALVKEKAAEMREALSKMATIKSIPAESIADKLTIVYTCTACRRKESSEFGWQFNDPCGARLPGPVREDERLACRGVMKVL
jgi:hypothetical protein